MNYCSNCGAPVVYRTPPGDDRPRHVCGSCGAVHYENPRIVVGCIPLWEGRILLCKRAIEPRCGKWTIPAGFLENGETMEEGAVREAYEEARAGIGDLRPYFAVDLPFIGQVYFIFTGSLKSGAYDVGEESLEVRLFSRKDIPWGDMAFPVIRECLKSFVEDSAAGVFPFRTGAIRDRGKPLTT